MSNMPDMPCFRTFIVPVRRERGNRLVSIPKPLRDQLRPHDPNYATLRFTPPNTIVMEFAPNHANHP